MQHPSWTFEKVIDNYCKTPAAGNLYLSSSELLEWLKETANLAKTCLDAYRLPCIPFVVVAFLDAQKFQTMLFKPRIWESPQCNLRDDLQFFIEQIETIMEVVRRYFAVSVLAAIFHFCDGFKKMFPYNLDCNAWGTRSQDWWKEQRMNCRHAGAKLLRVQHKATALHCQEKRQLILLGDWKCQRGPWSRV